MFQATGHNVRAFSWWRKHLKDNSETRFGNQKIFLAPASSNQKNIQKKSKILLSKGKSSWVPHSGQTAFVVRGGYKPMETAFLRALVLQLCIVTANLLQALVLESVAHQHCIRQGFERAMFTRGPKTRETYAEKERDRIVQAFLDMSRCNPAQLEQRFQRDKAKSCVAKVQKWTVTQLPVFHQTLFLKVDFVACAEPKKDAA